MNTIDSLILRLPRHEQALLSTEALYRRRSASRVARAARYPKLTSMQLTKLQSLQESIPRMSLEQIIALYSHMRDAERAAAYLEVPIEALRPPRKRTPLSQRTSTNKAYAVLSSNTLRSMRGDWQTRISLEAVVAEDHGWPLTFCTLTLDRKRYSEISKISDHYSRWISTIPDLQWHRPVLEQGETGGRWHLHTLICQTRSLMPDEETRLRIKWLPSPWPHGRICDARPVWTSRRCYWAASRRPPIEIPPIDGIAHYISKYLQKVYGKELLCPKATKKLGIRHLRPLLLENKQLMLKTTAQPAIASRVLNLTIQTIRTLCRPYLREFMSGHLQVDTEDAPPWTQLGYWMPSEMTPTKSRQVSIGVYPGTAPSVSSTLRMYSSMRVSEEQEKHRALWAQYRLLRRALPKIDHPTIC